MKMPWAPIQLYQTDSRRPFHSPPLQASKKGRVMLRDPWSQHSRTRTRTVTRVKAAWHAEALHPWSSQSTPAGSPGGRIKGPKEDSALSAP